MFLAFVVALVVAPVLRSNVGMPAIATFPRAGNKTSPTQPNKDVGKTPKHEWCAQTPATQFEFKWDYAHTLNTFLFFGEYPSARSRR